MKKRSVIAVIGLPLITFGIYSLVWLIKTKGEMNKLGAKIPTAWLLIVPIVNIYWLWAYSEGVGQVTNNKMSAIVAFILQFCLGFIGSGIIQSEFNKIEAVAADATIPFVPVQSIAPVADMNAAPSVSQMPVEPTTETMVSTPEYVEPTVPAMPVASNEPQQAYGQPEVDNQSLSDIES